MARKQVSADQSAKDFNIAYAQNLAADAADTARKARARGDHDLAQRANQTMNAALDQIDAWQGN